MSSHQNFLSGETGTKGILINAQTYLEFPSVILVDIRRAYFPSMNSNDVGILLEPS